MSVALIALIVLWWGLILYAVLGGADFGAGVWDLFAVGKQAERQRDLINHALGPVWEANHVWLIFLIVGLFNIFPAAFAALSTALFIPFTIVLVGIVLRGSAFVFRYYSTNTHGRPAAVWSRVFSVTSLITPFFLGAGAAAVASGSLVAANGIAHADAYSSWTSPFALTIGAMAVTLCASLAAIYLAVEASQDNDASLAEIYRTRALISGALTAVLGALGLYFSISEASLLWHGLLVRSLPVVIITMLIGLATAVTLYLHHYRLARVLVIAEAACLLGSWGLSQYPYVIPPLYTIDNSANSPTVIVTLLIGIAAGLVILVPSLYYLFAVFKLPYPIPGRRKTPPEAKKQAPAQEQPQQPISPSTT